MKKLGIIGGMGPLSTAVFYERVVELTPAGCDQDHFETVILSYPDIPKRPEYILGLSKEDPGIKLAEMVRTLENCGADVLAMPCVTAHYFYERLRQGTSLLFLNMIDETIRVLASQEVRCVGLLGTEGTYKAGILQASLAEAGIESLLPHQQDIAVINRTIFECIKQNREVDNEAYRKVCDNLLERGAGANLIACTDLSAYNNKVPLPPENLDMMEIYAAACVRECLS